MPIWCGMRPREFIKRLLPTDRARIGHFSDEIVMAPDDFTSDQTVLRVLRRRHAAGGRVADLDGHRSGRDGAPPRGRTAGDPAAERRPRQPARDQVHTDVKDVIYRAEYDEVMLYTIGLSGEEWQMSRGSRIGGGRGGRRGRGGMALSSKTEPPDPNEKLADESGGRYFLLEPAVDLGTLFARIADELHHQYWMGFVPAKLDEKVHALDVKVTHAGLTVRARKSYVAR